MTATATGFIPLTHLYVHSPVNELWRAGFVDN